MARGVNKVILVGNLGNDPDIKYTQGGMAICTLSLATTTVRKDREGNAQEKTEWHRVKLFGKLGEIAGEYLTKGRQVYVEGRLEYGSFEKDGVKHYTTDIIGDEMQMLGGGGQGDGGGSGRPAAYGGRSQGGRQAAERAPSERQASAVRQPPVHDGLMDDDDIPF
jgi:single-strand DNA-binding protein